MSAIDNLIEELSVALAFEDVRIQGYNELLSFPVSLLSEESRVEVGEAISWSSQRLSLIQTGLQALQALWNHGYPIRLQQIAGEPVIVELQSKLQALQIAVAEFDIAPEAILTVSEELPIES